MDGVKNIGFMIPIVLALVLIEWLVSKMKGKKIYQFSDSIVNMCCGMLERLFDLFFVVFLIFMFEHIYDNYTVFKFHSNASTLILALFVADFLAYWHHRLSHEINFLWAAHIVHHQSEELNLTTVFRVSAFAVINRAFFFIWLPILGFSPSISISVIIFIGVYQFVTHTRLVNKLGFLEYILVTPSSHRVHHARNEKYIDTNYGHVFIVWDRIFGTYQEETEEPEYGITAGFESNNAYWAYLSYWVSLFSRARNLKNWKDKLNLFIKSPSWTADNSDLHSTVNNLKKSKKQNKNIPNLLRAYILINVMLAILTFVVLLINKATFSVIVISFISLGITFTILTMGLMMDLQIRGWQLEFIRLVLIITGVCILFNEIGFDFVKITLFMITITIFMVWLIRLKDTFKVTKSKNSLSV